MKFVLKSHNLLEFNIGYFLNRNVSYVYPFRINTFKIPVKVFEVLKQCNQLSN